MNTMGLDLWRYLTYSLDERYHSLLIFETICDFDMTFMMRNVLTFFMDGRISNHEILTSIDST